MGIKPQIYSTGTMADAVGTVSVNGRMVGVAATTSPGTLVHQAPGDVAVGQRVTIQACNNDTVNRTLTLVWGTDSPGTGDKIIRTLYPRQGLRLIVDRAPLLRTLPIYAFADAANVVNILPEVQRL